MRPKSIIQFDRFYLGAMALSAINLVILFKTTLSGPFFQRSGMGMGYVIGSQVFSFALMLLLWFLISRHASGAAKWILTALTALGVLMTLPSIPALVKYGALALIPALAITALKIAAVVFLFRADARAWFARKGGVASDDESIFS